MEGKVSREAFPSIGTVGNPALFSDGYNLLLSYEIAPVAGGGITILAFANVIHFEQNPTSVEGTESARYPISPWRFTEVTDSDRTVQWRALNPRFWTISFQDVTVEVVFSDVKKVYETRSDILPSTALKGFLNK